MTRLDLSMFKASIQRGHIWGEISNIKFEISHAEPRWERQGSEESVLRPGLEGSPAHSGNGEEARARPGSGARWRQGPRRSWSCSEAAENRENGVLQWVTISKTTGRAVKESQPRVHRISQERQEGYCSPRGWAQGPIH